MSESFVAWVSGYTAYAYMGFGLRRDNGRKSPLSRLVERSHHFASPSQHVLTLAKVLSGLPRHNKGRKWTGWLGLPPPLVQFGFVR